MCHVIPWSSHFNFFFQLFIYTGGEYFGHYFNIDTSKFTIGQLTNSFEELGILNTLQNFMEYIMIGIMLWIVLTPIIGGLIYFIFQNLSIFILSSSAYVVTTKEEKKSNENKLEDAQIKKEA